MAHTQRPQVPLKVCMRMQAPGEEGQGAKGRAVTGRGTLLLLSQGSQAYRHWELEAQPQCVQT